MKTLLHVCCAPCANQCIEVLRTDKFEVSGFWYNPNIHPFTEYRARRNCLRDYAQTIELPVIEKNDYARVAIVGYAASSLGRKRGDIVAPRVARYHDCQIPGDFVPELTDPHPLLGHDDAVILTGDSFVDDKIIPQAMQRLGVESALFDMEATAICQCAEIFDLPVVVVKMVSDIPEEGDTEHSYDEFVDSHSDFGVFVDYLEKLK